jgi:hypothetical protein
MVFGLGSLLTVARFVKCKADSPGDRNGGVPMKQKMITLFAAVLETLWAAAAGAPPDPEELSRP